MSWNHLIISRMHNEICIKVFGILAKIFTFTQRRARPTKQAVTFLHACFFFLSLRWCACLKFKGNRRILKNAKWFQLCSNISLLPILWKQTLSSTFSVLAPEVPHSWTLFPVFFSAITLIDLREPYCLVEFSCKFPAFDADKFQVWAGWRTLLRIYGSPLFKYSF